MSAARIISFVSACFFAGAAAADETRFPDATWTKAESPEAVGWSSSHLATARAFSQKIGTTAVVIVQNGVVVDEWGDVAVKTPAHSMRKSLLSALIGIAVAEEKIDLSSTMADLGIDDNEPSLTEIEKQATVGDLIKARSGIFHPALYETKRMTASKPPRGSHAPGTFWHYNNWDFNALGTIYRRLTGEDIFEAFARRIAAPLQMQDYVPSDGEYISGAKSIHEAYPFRISARDLARFGLLYLREGRWNGQQIVPRPWVAESTRSHSEIGPNRGYGYMWWTGRGSFRQLKVKDPFYYASGYRRQLALVFPDLDLVIVHRINSDATKVFPPWRQVERLLRYILAAAGETDIGPDLAIEAANGARLDASDLERILPGSVLMGTSRESVPYRVTLQEDRTLSLVLDNGFSETGSWWVGGDKLCRRYTKLYGGKSYCFSLVKDGDVLRLFDDTDTFIFSVTLLDRDR